VHACKGEGEASANLWRASNGCLLTTGIRRFVECLKHSAKFLPSVTLGKESLANSTSATASLPSTFYRALGTFGTRQRKAIVMVTGNEDGTFAECSR
jgi:hypothetical protein